MTLTRWIAMPARHVVRSVRRNFGGQRVTRSDVLHVSAGAEGTTLIGVLARATRPAAEP